MKKSLFFSLFFSFLFHANAQTRYIFKDGREVTDCQIQGSTEKENCLRMFEWKAGKYTVHKPDDIKEYHIGKRKSYYSMPIMREDTTVMRFVRKIVDGETRLYCYYSGQYNIYIVQNPDTAVQLNRKDFKQGLSQVLSACPEKTEEIINNLQYNYYFLKKVVRQYNNDCRFTPINLKWVGFFAGTNLIFNTNPAYYMPASAGERMNLTFGAFSDVPIDASNFSFHGEIFYRGIQLKKSDEILYDKYHQDEPDIVDTIVYNSYFKQHSLNVPLMLRYYFPFNSVRPFVNAGIQMSLNLTKNSYDSSVFYRRDLESPMNELIFDNNVYSMIQPSFLFGGGLAFKLDKNRMVYLECRYCKLFDLVKDYYETSGISFLASLSF